MSDLVTPTGVLVTDAAPESTPWFAARRGGITGTDLPKILGDSKYGNALSVWLDKRGELPDSPAGEAARWGQLLEDVVATEWAWQNGVTVSPVGVLAHVEHPWRRASLDRLVYPLVLDEDWAGPREGLEVKTRSAYVSGRFLEGIPDDVLAQVAWGRHVSGLDRIHVAVLIGGQQMRSFTYERDDELEEYLVEQAQVVWDCIQSGIPPTVEPDGEGLLLGLLNRLYGQREGDRDLSDRAEYIDSLLASYANASEQAKAYEADKVRYRTELVRLLDDAEAAVVNGEVRFTYKRPAASLSLATAARKRLAKERPDLHAALVEGGYLTTTQGEPRFRVATTKETADV